VRYCVPKLLLSFVLLSASPFPLFADQPEFGTGRTTTLAETSKSDRDGSKPDDKKPLKTASAKTGATQLETDRSDPGTVITLLLAGDTGFNQSRQRVLAKGVRKNGKFQTWEETLSKFIEEISGDLNFANVETVVTENNSLAPRGPNERFSFRFRSHPNGFRFLAQSGFNLFSLANNHSLDFGRPGLRETLKHFSALKSQYNIAYSGIGENREQAGTPAFIRVKNINFAFSAISFIPQGSLQFRAGSSTPGQLSYHKKSDLSETVSRLSDADSEYKILSIHYGRERYTKVNENQKRKWRQLFVKNSDIDLVVAHHAHVAQGVELTDGKLIFYGLGNFLHHGMANMSSQGICRDYGLVARVHLLKNGSGKISVRAVEAIPVADMHIQTSRLSSVQASHLRIRALNYLSKTLTSQEDNSEGLQFSPQHDGSGLYCKPGAHHDPAPISKLCEGWTPPKPVSESLQQRLIRECTDRNWSRYRTSRRYITSKPSNYKSHLKESFSFNSFIQSN